MQPHPSAETPQLAAQIRDMAAHFAVLPRVYIIFAIQPVGRGVLRDHQQFIHTRIHQLFRLAQHGVRRARRQFAAHVRNDAELTLVIAAFRDFQIAVMPRCQRHTCRGQQINKRIRRGRHGIVHGIQDLLILVRARHGQNTRMMFADIIRLGTKTARHDHPPVFRQGFANRIKTFGLGAVQKPAGVHNHRISPHILSRDAIAFGPQPCQNTL